VNDKANQSVNNVAIDSLQLLGIKTDHNAILLDIEWNSIRQKDKKVWKTMWKRKDANWNVYKEAVEIRLANFDQESDVADAYEEWQTKVLSAAEEAVGKKKVLTNGKKKSKSWWNEEIEQEYKKRKQMNQSKRKMLRNIESAGAEATPEENRNMQALEEQYKKQKEIVTEHITKAKNKQEKEQIQSWRELHPDQRESEMWKYIKRLLDGDKIKNKTILIDNGIEKDNTEEIIEVIEKYWKSIFNDAQAATEMANEDLRYMADITHCAITEEELNLAVKRMKNRKAVDEDGVMAEFIKFGGENMRKIITHLFNEILKTKWIPTQWKKSRICLIFKGSGKNRKEISSYRPVAVVSIASKLFGAVISDRKSVV
jgi:hypothetical protein